MNTVCLESVWWSLDKKVYCERPERLHGCARDLDCDKTVQQDKGLMKSSSCTQLTSLARQRKLLLHKR